MFQNKVLRYSFFGAGLLSVGFLSAFFIDHKISNAIYSTENKEQIAPKVEDINTETFSNIENSLKKIGEPWGSVVGLTMFRGSPTRTFYGIGPLPAEPKVLWRYPGTDVLGNIGKPMCSFSEAEGVTKQWCGSGWTGQPVVWERPDGITEVIFGAYDGAVHFVDAKTGKETRPKFQTGDLIKGSITLDPDGFPLIYFGSRDNKLRIVALDRDIPTELWALNADEVKGKWNNDWDGNPVVINDFLFEGGENSWFFTMKINRSYVSDADSVVDMNVSGEKIAEKKVAIAPQIVFKMPGWNDELLKNIGDQMVSIENSVTFFGNRVYFANSGGRILGLDISKIAEGIAPIVFDYWVGDDTDATIVVDEKGMLYVATELERMNARSAELGQLIKLDPYKQTIILQTTDTGGQITTQTTGDPYVWGIQVPKEKMAKGGIWATPALFGNYLYVATHTGNLLTVDRETGSVTNKDYIGEHAWSSPVVIAGTDTASTEAVGAKLLVVTCSPGGFRQYDLSNPAIPKLTNTMLHTGGACIESTPAVWKGQIFVGTRDGYFYSFGDK